MIEFRRDDWANTYAQRHLITDPGIQSVHYLPEAAPDREIRLIEVNDLMMARDDDLFEPIDFGVDTGSEDAHTLMVLDVTPAQWEKILLNPALLPNGWSLEGQKSFERIRPSLTEIA